MFLRNLIRKKSQNQTYLSRYEFAETAERTNLSFQIRKRLIYLVDNRVIIQLTVKYHFNLAKDKLFIKKKVTAKFILFIIKKKKGSLPISRARISR